MAIETTTIDEQKLEAFVGLAANEAGAALNAALVALGDELGLYKAMADGRPVDAATLAARTGTHERYVLEWLNVQAASGFVLYAPATKTYILPPEHALVLADDSTPAAMGGNFQAVRAAVAATDQLIERFRDGEGLGWHEQHQALARHRALVRRRLQREPRVRVAAGARRRGRQAPGRCVGGRRRLRPRHLDDPDGPGVPGLAVRRLRLPRGVGRDRAGARRGGRRRGPRAVRGGGRGGLRRRGLRPRGVLRRLPRSRRPVAAARHAAAVLAPGGTCMLVEPFAHDEVQDNINPIGRMYYGFSTLVCTPGSLSQPGRAGLGTQAGEARLREALQAGGFATVRRAAETELNLVLEARLA